MTRLAGLFLVLTGALTRSANAHSLFTNLYVNNVDQGDGTCVRTPKDPSTSTYPVIDLSSNDMVCGFDGTTPVQRTCAVPQGSMLGFEYRLYPDKSQSGSVEPSHKGPCSVYLKAVPSASEASGEGGGWFKIWEDGYHADTGDWCSDRVIQNNGILSVNLPPDLAGGNYLVRSELLSLHEADKDPPQPQFYVGCAQIYLDSNASSAPQPQNTVSIPGYVQITDPSVLFNIYRPNSNPYPMPGPSIYTTGVPVDRSAYKIHTEGLLPPQTVAVNGNWWGTEQEAYSTQDGCWNASTNCFDQLKTCYNSAPATGSAGCKQYEKKCTKMQSGCEAGDYNGPPDQGKILTKGVKGNVKHHDKSASSAPDAGLTAALKARASRVTRHLM